MVFRTQLYKPTLFTSWIPPCWSQQALNKAMVTYPYEWTIYERGAKQSTINHSIVMLQSCPISEFLSVLVLFLSIILHLIQFILRLNQVKTWLEMANVFQLTNIFNKINGVLGFVSPWSKIRVLAQDDIARIVSMQINVNYLDTIFTIFPNCRWDNQRM